MAAIALQQLAAAGDDFWQPAGRAAGMLSPSLEVVPWKGPCCAGLLLLVSIIVEFMSGPSRFACLLGVWSRDRLELLADALKSGRAAYSSEV